VKRPRWLPWLLGLAPLLWAVAVFHQHSYFQFGDWDQYQSFFEAQRRSLVVYGQIPWWNPYHLGGFPGVAHPQFNAFSPFFFPVLLLGTVAGTAGFFVLHAVTAFAGAYLLARRLQHAQSGAFLAALSMLFMLGPLISGGVVNRANASLVPWLLWTFFRTLKDRRWVAGFALVVALIVLEGGFYALVGGGLLLGLIVLLQGRWSCVVKLSALALLGLFLGLGLAAIRLVPTVELYLEFPRRTPELADAAMLDPGAFRHFLDSISALLLSPVTGRRDVLFGEPLFVGVHLGVPLMALLVFGAVCVRHDAVCWCLFGFFLLLVLGRTSPLNLWALLRKLPGLWSLNLPMSMMMVMAIPLGWLLSNSLGRLVNAVFSDAGAASVAAAMVVGLTSLAPLLYQHCRLLESHPRAGLPELAGIRTPFVTSLGNRSAMLPSVLQNRGVLFAYEEVIRERLESRWREGRPAAEGEPGYRGEYFLENTGSVNPRDFTPNHLVFDLDLDLADVLMVNQNHASGWKARFAGRPIEVRNRRGLLSVAVPAGTGTLELSYRPDSATTGAWISAACVLACLVLGSSRLKGLWGTLRLAADLSSVERMLAAARYPAFTDEGR